ncbi:MAG TPA: AAA family ATPase, partial [Gemmatimonadales bacterium]|nr:AAA family ATPase [Gemmatimonadales bacterium]
MTPSMPNRHHLRCLGEPALVAPTGRPVEFRTRKALGLLVFLAVEPRPHLRETLAEMFWSRAGQSESRHSLANAISEIRRRLGRPAVETTGDRVRLRGDVLALDLERLMAGEILGDDVVPPLDVDGFLEGFELPDAVGFAHWKESRRAGLIPFIRDALVLLIDRARRTGDFPGLGRLGDRLARFDELSEDAIRARMESRAFAGDRLGALRLYEQWKVELAGQLGAAPSELLEGMATRLRRRGWERPGAAGAPAVRTESWRDRPFVGRSNEYRSLYESWEATVRGAPCHRLVLGDSGVGKSTLVERFAAVAALEGATVVRTQCHEL